MEDGLRDQTHLTSRVILDANGGGSNRHGFHQRNGSFSISCSVNLVDGNCAGWCFVIMFAGCKMEGVPVMFAPLGADSGLIVSKGGSALNCNGVAIATGWTASGDVQNLDNIS